MADRDQGRPRPDAGRPPPRDRGAPPPPPRDGAPPPPPPEDASVPTAPEPPPDSDGPSVGELVINEVDYNQPGEDHGEFIELLVTADRVISLEGIRVELFSASDSARVRCAGFAPAPDGPSRYGCAELPPEIVQPGDYIVLTAQGEGPAVPPGTLRLELLGRNPGSGVIENSTEGVLLINRYGRVLDGFAYEGEVPGVGEGLPPNDDDSDSNAEEGVRRPEHAFGRCPDGRDTNDNATDFLLLTPPTAGFDNACP
ncbi:MAG: lamin tail domain-containing protein [bacterium]